MNLIKIILVSMILINISIFIYGFYKLKKFRRISEKIKKYFKNFK